VLLTGAAGFVGQAVVAALANDERITHVRMIDRCEPPTCDDPRFEGVSCDLTDVAAIPRLLSGIDAIIHLASIPGGTAEGDPALSRAVNVDATLALLEHLDRQNASTRFVYASSIAVFGHLHGPVNDLTAPAPDLIYGLHKLMAEMALANFCRRGSVEGIALRLPGIVARPLGNSGLKSAFMSDIFHAAASGSAFTMPVNPEATMWLMSADCVAANLIHAIMMPKANGLALNLPALRVRAADLVAGLYRDPSLVAYKVDPLLEQGFGSYPPLSTPEADSLGFSHDGSLEALIAAAMPSQLQNLE